MPTGLRRYQQEGDDHFLTFTCYHRLPHLNTPTARDLFLKSLESTRKRYNFQILGYVVHARARPPSPQRPKPTSSANDAVLLCYHQLNEETRPMNTATSITIAVLTALTPTVTCLIGIILTRQDVRDLRGEMNNLRTDLRGEMSALRTDVQQQLDSFRSEIRTDMLAMRKDVHANLLMIHERVANVEGRQSR